MHFTLVVGESKETTRQSRHRVFLVRHAHDAPVKELVDVRGKCLVTETRLAKSDDLVVGILGEHELERYGVKDAERATKRVANKQYVLSLVLSHGLLHCCENVREDLDVRIVKAYRKVARTERASR